MFIRQWTARSHAWSADPDTFNGICGEEGEIPRLQRIVICEFCWPTLRLRLACQRRIVHLQLSHSCTAKCCPTVMYFLLIFGFSGFVAGALWLHPTPSRARVCVLFLPWTLESFPFMFWRWRNKLKWAPFELFAPSSSLRVRSWLHPFKGHCEQKAERDEGVIYVAGHPLLNRRCTRIPLMEVPKMQGTVYSLTVLKVPLNSNQSINLVHLL